MLPTKPVTAWLWPDEGAEVVRMYHCGRCGHDIDFAASRCADCGAELGFWPQGDQFFVLADDVSGPGDQRFWRCLNAAWGCNWIVEVDSEEIWCRSCRLTRSRPDTGRPDAIAAWEIAEGFKRRLIHQLMTLGLPIGAPPPGLSPPGSQPHDEPGTLVFDLVYLPGNPGMTGHRPGAITLDLREVDNTYRDQVRLSLGEVERTVLGHLRHEVGHHYWRVLVDAPAEHGAFRAHFGDERADYDAALELHYTRPPEPPPASHITFYATSHPAEDWAETFAHYLAIRDGLETVEAYSHGLVGNAQEGDLVSCGHWVERWRRTSEALNALTAGLGHDAPYPYRITEQVSAKLVYVHECVSKAQRPRGVL